jgi:transposase
MLATGDVPLGANLTRDAAERIYALGKEAVIFALLEQAKLLRERQAGMPLDVAPATPSGQTPTYLKAPPKKRSKRRGKKPGQRGSRRPTPPEFDETQEHRADVCPDCGGPLNRCRETRERYTEDIPDDLQPQVTRHVIHRDWCPGCQKHVEAKVPEALPKAKLGHRTLALSAWLHYALGNTTSQIVAVFNAHLRLKLTDTGLLSMWHRLAEVLRPWYEQIREEALNSAVLHGDESGWRVNGKTHWLWCFCTRDVTFYLIDRSRGSPALKKMFRREFAGTLVSDFWSAYNAFVGGSAQKCLSHLLRELKHTDQYKSPGPGWPAFRRKLRRLVRDAIRLRKAHGELSAEAFVSRRRRIHARLRRLIATDWQDQNARRLVKRLTRHRHELFTFLEQLDVPFDNNHAEREIRPAVLMRKTSYGNRSDRGAETQEILMTVLRTLKQRGYQPLDLLPTTLAHYIKTGQLTPMPQKVTPDE